MSLDPVTMARRPFLHPSALRQSAEKSPGSLMKSGWDLPMAQYLCQFQSDTEEQRHVSGLKQQVPCRKVAYKYRKWLVMPSCKNQAKNDATCETEAHLLKANKSHHLLWLYGRTVYTYLPFWKPALAFIKDFPQMESVHHM